MALFDLSGLIDKLGESPQVQEAFAHLTRIRDIFAKSMIRLDQRFDGVDFKLDRIIMYLENPSNMVPAKDDGLITALATVSVLECPIDGCTNTAVHSHAELLDGNVAVQVKSSNLVPFPIDMEKLCVLCGQPGADIVFVKGNAHKACFENESKAVQVKPVCPECGRKQISGDDHFGSCSKAIELGALERVQ